MLFEEFLPELATCLSRKAPAQRRKTESSEQGDSASVADKGINSGLEDGDALIARDTGDIPVLHSAACIDSVEHRKLAQTPASKKRRVSRKTNGSQEEFSVSSLLTSSKEWAPSECSGNCTKQYYNISKYTCIRHLYSYHTIWKIRCDA